jgi:FtsH-binding integral membrane protein
MPTSVSQTLATSRPSLLTGRNSLLDRYFYFAMSLASAAAVVAGFSQTIDDQLLHPAIAPPPILWVHGLTFSAWIMIFILQSALVRTRHVKWHRTIGWLAAAVALIMVPLGLATAIAMVHFETYSLHMPHRYAFLAVPFFDIGTFGLCMALAIYWRKNPEFHRRLVFFATCALLVAAFARMDHAFARHHNLSYLGADLMLALGIGRDLLVNRSIHTVYRIGVPLYCIAQFGVIYLAAIGPDWWVRIGQAIAG